MKKRMLSLILSLVLVLGLFCISAAADGAGTVYISAAHEGRFLDGMAYVPVSLDDLAAIDLEEYNMGEFAYDADGDGKPEVTAIHLAIYAHENIYGEPWTDGIISGTPGSSYFSGGLFGWDENMRYNFNGEFPADENGWGITTDQLVLSDGDYIDFSHYTSFSAPMDMATGFHYFTQEDAITHEYTTKVGQPLNIKLVRANSDIYSGLGTVHYEAADHSVYYSKQWYAPDAEVVTTESDGTASVTFTEAGTYYLWADGAYGLEPDWMTGELCIVSSPAYAKVIVTEDVQPEPATYAVSLPAGAGYTATATEGFSSPVMEGGSFCFTVTVHDRYDGANIVVKANDTVLIAVDGVYTISDITADQIVVIEGVVEKQEEPTVNWQDAMAQTQQYLMAKAAESTPVVSSTNGEWLVLGLARSGKEADFYKNYCKNVVAYVQENIDENGRLHKQKSTDNSRVILALTAIGKDVTNVDGHNLLLGLTDMAYVKNQGINGPIFALLALDCGGYELPAGSEVTRELLISYILENQLPDGGWALAGNAPDDMTPMAVQALAPYYDTDAQVKAAVDKALDVMTTMQATPETYAQMIVARSALGLDSADVMEKLLQFALSDGSFEKTSGSSANQMTTEQAFYAMVAYDRFMEGKTPLYDMSDVTIEAPLPPNEDDDDPEEGKDDEEEDEEKEDEEEEEDLIRVSFRLIGDTKHDDGVEGHEEYVTWIPTTSYELKPGATMYDVFTAAISDYGLSQRGASGNYVEQIKAPACLGGFWLGEFDNGPNSGWMYTVNGEHPGTGLKTYDLEDGDRIIWHYTDDYLLEERSSSSKYYYRWLEAEDISPKKYKEEHEDEEQKETNVSADFADVKEGDWFYEDVMYAVGEGLFNGTSATAFSPNASMSRAMLVTVLYRLDGEPAVTGTESFRDVENGTWYTAAVNWATKHKIAGGYGNGLFGPDDPITREQMAAILLRYAQYKNYSTSASGSLSDYHDFYEISDYALGAIEWAKGENLMSGRTAVTLAPKGTATRAEVAAILHRFVENVAND